MDILLKRVRIQNFRSIKSIDLELGETNVLIGQNNSGKSNFLRAINIALSSSFTISADDIYISKDERLDSTKNAIIDIQIRPVNTEKVIEKHFSDFWTSIFTDTWITTDETNGDFVGIRTIIQFDIRKNDYTIIRKPISEWRNADGNVSLRKKKLYTSDMVEYLSSFYMDAQRDVVDDIQNKKSYFGKATSKMDLSEEKIIELEKKLDSVNEEIINNIPALSETSSKIAAIGKTIGAPNSSVMIEPLARNLSDLHKGMDVMFNDGNAAKLSISQHGMGTRSWVSFLTLGAYVEWQLKSLKDEDPEADNYVMLTLEEPEAHLHPQAQRQLYSQIDNFAGQKIISTHSPNIVAQAKLQDIIHFRKQDGETIAYRFKQESYTQEEIKRIQREVINTRGELLFSTAVILCEGVTEEQALPIFFKEYFGIEPTFCGINIIGIGGQNYKTFLNLIHNFNISWFIFSDGETDAIKTVKKAVKSISDDEISILPNIIILDNKENYEKHLIASGYGKQIVDGINTSEDNENYFAKYLRDKNHTDGPRHATSKPRCKTCGQEIYESEKYDYEGTEGYKRAIYDCCTKPHAKARYASFIAKKIVSLSDESKRIPPKVKDLFKVVSENTGLNKRK